MATSVVVKKGVRRWRARARSSRTRSGGGVGGVARPARLSQVLARAKAAIDATTVIEDPQGARPWQFDPATGTTLPVHE